MSIESTLLAWVNGATGREVAVEHQDGPKQTRMPATLKNLTREPAGIDERSQVNQEPADGIDIIETISGHRVDMWSVKLFGSATQTPSDDMELLKLSARSSANEEIFRSAGIGLNRFSDTRDITGLDREHFQETVQADFFFNTSFAASEVVNTIHEVNITNADTGEDINVQIGVSP